MSSLQSLFVTATVTCHDFPFLPNQSRCVSLKLAGKNFMAQSIMSKTWLGNIFSMMALLAASWWAARRMWAFHSSTLGTAVFTLCLISSSWSLPLWNKIKRLGSKDKLPYQDSSNVVLKLVQVQKNWCSSRVPRAEHLSWDKLRQPFLAFTIIESMWQFLILDYWRHD